MASAVKAVMYRECMKNHAAASGGYVSDGCCEFMQKGEDPLTCAVCGCHRNFHRKEVPGIEQPPPPQMLAYNFGLTPRWDVKLQAPTGHVGLIRSLEAENRQVHDDRRSETPDRREMHAGQMTSARRKKRFRTKFTLEQKEKMLEFAERIGWKIQGRDDAEINGFCMQTGVSRTVLKVWLHNHKNVYCRKEVIEQPHDVGEDLPTDAANQPVVEE